MEIKQGDKVRILDNVPEIYTQTIFFVHISMEMEVVKVQDGSARIRPILSGLSEPSFEYIIPIKYLIKVDAEAKEAKFKVGDWVKVGETPNPRLNGRVGTISQIDKEGYEISFNDGFFTVVSEEDLTLADEPTEQTEENARIRQIEAELDELRKSELYRMLYPEEPKFEVAIDNVAMNWQRYEADLAKELAIAYGKRGKSPLDAVAAAKEITKRLKQK